MILNNPNHKHIHILGIAGTMTAPLALYLSQKGIKVTGSDQQKIYPPVSTILDSAGIEINKTPITNNIDLVLVGGAYAKFSWTKTEYDQARALGIPCQSATVFLGQLMESKNPIVVAGTFGKTTISAALAWALTEMGSNPSYFFGGFTPAKFPSLAVRSSDYSVIEGSEDINGLDTGPKFNYYPLKHLLLTSADWEHHESYPTSESNTEAFISLAQRLTADSVFVYNPNSDTAKTVSRTSLATPTVYDLSLMPLIKTNLIGQANRENLMAAATLLLRLGFAKTKVLDALSTFPGIKRRLEILHQSPETVVIDDFAQSAPRVKATLEAVKSQFPQHRLITFFEAHATSLLYKQSLPQLALALAISDEIVLGPLPYSSTVSKDDRSTPSVWGQLLGSKLTYLPDPAAITPHLISRLTPPTALVHMSSGGQTGLNILDRIVTQLKSATI